MKYTILISLLFVFSFSKSQNVFDIMFEDESKNVLIANVIEDGDNNYIFVGGKTDEDNSLPYLVKTTETGEILTETDLGIEENYFLRHIINIDTDYIIVAQEYNSDTIMFIKTSYDFVPEWQKKYSFFGQDTVLGFSSFIKNSNNELIFMSYSQVIADNVFVCRFNLEGDLLNYKIFQIDENMQNIWSVQEIPNTDEEYLFSGYNFIDNDFSDNCQIIRMNKHFEITNVIEAESVDDPWKINNGNSDLKFLTDTTFIHASKTYLYPNGPQDEDICIQLYDTSFNLLNEVTFGKLDTIEYLPPINGLDFIDKNNIYVGALYPFNYENWNMLTKLNENLEIEWSYTYGEAIHYQLREVKATQDSGCILSIVYFPEDGYIKNYIIKIDKDGNSSLPTSIYKEIFLKTNNFSIYPNPGTTELTIQKTIQTGNYEFYLYNTTGKLILQQNLNSQTTTINTQTLQTGIYIYKIILENHVIETGKWVKE